MLCDTKRHDMMRYDTRTCNEKLTGSQLNPCMAPKIKKRNKNKPELLDTVRNIRIIVPGGSPAEQSLRWKEFVKQLGAKSGVEWMSDRVKDDKW